VKKSAEVIVIGAGVIGTSIAYHLAKSGCCDVIVLEKDNIGEGSTSKCAGGIRQQFSAEVNVRLSMEGLEFLKHFEEEMGYPDDFRQRGGLMLATTEDELEILRQNSDLQPKLGVEVYLLSPKEVKGIIPELSVEDIIGATYCPTDGVADPYSVVQGFASAARRLGVKIYTETEVIGLQMLKGSKVKRVLTSNGEFEAPIVVNAAGPYAGQIGKMVDLHIPVRPSKQQSFFTSPTDKIPQNAPSVLDVHTLLAVGREGPGLMFGMREPNAPEGFDITIDWSSLPSLAELAVHRFPFFNDIGVVRAQAGLKANTPDYSAILGKVAEVEGLYLACGFSGHGFMHSPAVGRLMAGYILHREHNSTISLLGLGRFKSGNLLYDDKWMERRI